MTAKILNNSVLAALLFATTIVALFCVMGGVSEDSDAAIGEEFTDGVMKYKITVEDDPNYEVSVIDNKDYYKGSIEIPSSVNHNEHDYKVTAIGGQAFFCCYELTSVTIPDSVVKIEYRAFLFCKLLTSVTIPDSVTTMGDEAFRFCEKLTSLTISDSITKLGSGVFEGCELLPSVVIPDSVTSIDNSAFKGCSKLASIFLPDSVTEVNNSAFADCVSLKSVSIGNCTFSKVGNNVFSGCELESITIAENAEGFQNLFSYEFYDENGNLLTDDNAIAGHKYRINGEGKMYDVNYKSEDSNGQNIGWIIGIIVVIVALAGAGAYFFLRSKKQQKL